MILFCFLVFCATLSRVTAYEWHYASNPGESCDTVCATGARGPCIADMNSCLINDEGLMKSLTQSLGLTEVTGSGKRTPFVSVGGNKKGYFYGAYTGTFPNCQDKAALDQRICPCQNCPVGKWSLVYATECQFCAAGTYKVSNEDLGACHICPSNSGTGSSTGSTASTDCVAAAGYTGPNGGTPLPCGAGTYKAATGAAACDICPTGKTTSGTGSTSVVAAVPCASHPCPSLPGTDVAANAHVRSGLASLVKDEAACCAYCKSLSGCKTWVYGNPGDADANCWPIASFTKTTAKSSRTLGGEGAKTGKCLPCSASATECRCVADSVLKLKSTQEECACVLANAGYTGPDGGTPNSQSACLVDTFKAATGAAACNSCPSNSGTGSSTGSTASTDCVAAAGYTGPNGGTPLPCGAGTYKAATGAAACDICPTGKTTSGTGSMAAVNCGVCSAGHTGSSCAACGAGQYKASTGPAGCDNCPSAKFKGSQGQDAISDCVTCDANSDAPAGSDGGDDCLCKAGYTGTTTLGGSCSLCGTDTYKDETGAAACKNCPTNSGSPVNHVADELSSSCLAFAGYSGSGSAVAPCAVGKYKAESPSQQNCQDCPPHSVTLNANSSTITDCVADKGYFGPHGGTPTACAAGKFKAEPLIDCNVIDRLYGSHKNYEQIKCDVASQHTFNKWSTYMQQAKGHPNFHSLSDYQNYSVCNDCLENWYAPAQASGMCTNCALGTYTKLKAQLSCIDCEAGKHSYWQFSWQAQDTCIDCTVGKWSDQTKVEGAHLCIDCPAGKYTYAEKDCGSYGNCFDSKASRGHSSIAGCKDCSAGKYIVLGDKTGATLKSKFNSCTSCEAGKYNTLVGQENCISCEAGKYRDLSTRASDTCTRCEAGKYNPSTGQENCTSCEAAGKYKAVTGATSCSPLCSPELTAFNNSVVHRGVFGEAPEIKLQVMCAEGLALELDSSSVIIVTVAGGGDAEVRLEGPSEYRLKGPSNDIAVVDNTSIVLKNNSAASGAVPVSLTLSLGSDSSISVVVNFILSSPIVDVMGVLALTAAEAKVVGEVVAGVVVAAVAGSVAASAASALASGGAGGAGGGAGGGGGGGGGSASPVQFLIAKCQICSLAGDIRLDLGAPHAGFTAMFGAANLQPGKGSPKAEKSSLLSADGNSSIIDMLDPEEPDPDDPAALQRSLMFTIVVAFSALLIPLIIACLVFGLGFACLRAAGRSEAGLFSSVKRVTLFVEALVMNTLSMGAVLISMRVFKTANQQTPGYVTIACFTVIIFLVGWNVFLALRIHKTVIETHYTEPEGMTGRCCSPQASPESQVAPETSSDPQYEEPGVEEAGDENADDLLMDFLDHTEPEGMSQVAPETSSDPQYKEPGVEEAGDGPAASANPDDADVKKPSRLSMLLCGWRKPNGRWTVEKNDSNIALGSYYLRFRFASRFYFVAFNFKQVMMGVAIIFLPPVPSLWLMLSCEVIHGALVMWTMPFLVVWDHVGTMGSCIAFSAFYILILAAVGPPAGNTQLLADTGTAEPSGASNYSTLLVGNHLVVLLMQLGVQFAPIFEKLAECGGLLYEFFDARKRAGSTAQDLEPVGTFEPTGAQSKLSKSIRHVGTMRHVMAAGVVKDSIIGRAKVATEIDQKYATMKKAFGCFDVDNSGALDKEEFRRVMSMSTGENSIALSDAQFESLFEKVDTDKSGVISFEEYFAWATR